MITKPQNNVLLYSDQNRTFIVKINIVLTKQNGGLALARPGNATDSWFPPARLEWGAVFRAPSSVSDSNPEVQQHMKR